VDIEPFELERWLARFETDAEVMLGESGVRAVEASRFDTDPGKLGYVIPTDGDPALRERVASWYDRGADEVVFTCGTQEANLLAFLSTLSAGGHAVVVTPTYQSLRSLPATIGAVTTVELEPPDWNLDPDAVADAMRPDTDAIVVVNPNNPTGKVHDEATMAALYDLAADADAYLHADEVYRDLAADPAPRAASMGPRALSTAGLSKAWGLPGLRFGWLAGPPEIVDRARHWKDYTTISPPQFGQHVAAQAFDREAELLGEHGELYRHNRERVASFLEDHGMEWHTPQSVVGFPTIPEGFDDSEAFCLAAFEEVGVLLVPGTVFGYQDRYRIGFGRDTAVLESGLDRLGKLLEQQ
jgi:aspartate/methionine/tyrosine aminotransferase